ncbi:hypothetical protein SKAU_G00098720 [Synaphobranchus kaupii]|uniref:Uncharacterized protein n=1 Tax=Synaphobranchus kaupii TaxID=118154 RepID=A0A9Q1J6X2_SYNKA|nr:hypothetical protein SKAU_G00098720 [Synaphobranchus kaupii]
MCPPADHVGVSGLRRKLTQRAGGTNAHLPSDREGKVQGHAGPAATVSPLQSAQCQRDVSTAAGPKVNL